MISILQKISRFCVQARKLCPPETLLLTTKGSCWHKTIRDRKRDKILGRMENSRLLNRKAKILWSQLEINLQNYKDLYRKPLKRDWRAKRLLPILILLNFLASIKIPLLGYKPKNLHVMKDQDCKSCQAQG